MKIIMTLDACNTNGRIFFAGNTYNVKKEVAKYFINNKKAKIYDLTTAKRTVILDGEKITWGEYLSRRKKQTKNER